MLNMASNVQPDSGMMIKFFAYAKNQEITG